MRKNKMFPSSGIKTVGQSRENREIGYLRTELTVANFITVILIVDYDYVAYKINYYLNSVRLIAFVLLA